MSSTTIRLTTTTAASLLVDRYVNITAPVALHVDVLDMARDRAHGDRTECMLRGLVRDLRRPTQAVQRL